MVTWNYIEIGAQDFGMSEEVLNQNENRTHFCILRVWIHMPNIIGSISCLIAFRSSKIVNQTILLPLDVLHIHIDTVVASCN